MRNFVVRLRPDTGALRGKGAFSSPRRRRGQVVVELMLILPVLFLMIFFILEIGNLAFQTILAHHAAYELARIGSLVSGPAVGASSPAANVTSAQSKLVVLVKTMFPGKSITLSCSTEMTGIDPQVAQTRGNHINEDIIVTMIYPVKLLFPGSSYFFATPRGSGIRNLTVKVRMPIEKPIFQ